MLRLVSFTHTSILAKCQEYWQVVLTRPFRTTLVLGILACTAGLSAHNTFAQQDQDQKKFEDVKKRIAELKAELERTKTNRDTLHQTLESNEKEIQTLNKKTQTMKQTLDQKQSHLQELHNERDTLEKKKNEQAEYVGDYLKSAYRLGHQSELQLLFNQRDPAQVARMMKYYQHLSDNRIEKIEAFITVMQRIEAIEPEIARETSELQNQYRQLKNQQAKLRTAQATRKKTLSKLQSDVASKEQRLAGLREDQRRLEKLLVNVYEEMNASELSFKHSKFSSLKGKLKWPLRGKALNRYGASRGGNLRWQGLQISASRGTPVTAIHHGQVVFSDYLRGHGLLLIIDHGAGYMSLYAHNDQLNKELGEWVESGETIATVGNTGGRSDTALYFELRYQGKSTNPSSWFGKA